MSPLGAIGLCQPRPGRSWEPHVSRVHSHCGSCTLPLRFEAPGHPVKRVAPSFRPPQNPEEDQEGLRGATCPTKFWGRKGTAATVCSAEARTEPRTYPHVTLTQGTEDAGLPYHTAHDGHRAAPVAATKMGTNASH